MDGELMDFSLKMFEKLSKSISNSSYSTFTVEKFLLLENKPKRFIILRHDIDSKSDNALRMSKIEKNYGLCSTYYFRILPSVFKIKLMKEIESYGHEIGFHYESLDAAEGDFDNAIKIFKKELETFRGKFDIKTICSHGNSFTPYYNGDMWKNNDFHDFDLIGEAYESIDFDSITYFSDVGRKWSDSRLRCTNDLINLISREEEDKIYILTHSETWPDNIKDWARMFTRSKLPPNIQKTVRSLKKKFHRELQ